MSPTNFTQYRPACPRNGIPCSRNLFGGREVRLLKNSLLLAILSLAAVAPAASLSPADVARAECDPGRSGGGWPDYQWAGSRRTVSGTSIDYINAVKSEISYFDAFVYPWSPGLYQSNVSTWVQLVRTATYPYDGWVKFGHYERRVPSGGTSFMAFVHMKPRGYSAPSYVNHYSPTLGTGPTYELRYNEDSFFLGSVDAYRNGNLLAGDMLLGFGGPSDYPPDQANVAGQADMVQDQMPGFTNQKVDFTDTSISRNGSSTWQAFSGTGFNTNPNEYGLYGHSTTWFTIWD